MRRTESQFILFGQVLAGALSLLATTLSARYVGPQAFGFCAIFILLLNLGMSLTDFGACSWAAREYASESISSATYRFIMKSKTRIALGLIFLTPFIFILSPENFKWSVVLVFYPALWIRFNFVQQFLVAANKLKESVALVILERACWLLVFPLSLMKSDKVIAYSAPILIGLLLHGIIGNRFLSINDSLKIPSRVFGQVELYKLSKNFGVISLSGVIRDLDGFMVAVATSVEQSANYVLAQRFRNPLTMVLTSVAIRIKPLAAKKDPRLIKAALLEDANLIKIGIFMNFIFSIFFYFYSKITLGDFFQDVDLIVFFGTLTAIPLGVIVLSSTLLSAVGKEKLVARLNTAYTFLILIGAIVSSHYYGSLGAVITIFIIILIYSIIFSLVFKKELRRLK